MKPEHFSRLQGASSTVRRTRLRRATTWLRKPGAIILAAVLGLSVGWPSTAPAHAATVYEIQGEWQEPVNSPVESGDALVSVWRFNINDDAPAPGNEPVDDVTVTFTAQNGRFTNRPTMCLTDGVSPASSISPDGSTLTCNLGTRDQGTAELMLAGLQVDGLTGENVSISGEIGGVTSELPEIPIVNEFAMDMKFDGGSPRTTIVGDQQTFHFPWALRHAPGAEAGPSSVSYDLQFTGSNGEVFVSEGCAPIAQVYATYPYSEAGFGADRTAPFPAACSFTQLSPNQFRLTLSGIDYSKSLRPTLDSRGIALPTEWDVVASGLLNVRFTYTTGMTGSFTASAPTYTSVENATSIDDPANNVNTRAATRGSWTGGWQLNFMNPPVSGTIWTDTFRTMAGQPALAVSGVRAPNSGATASTQVCSIYDTRYLDVEEVVMGTLSNGVVNPYSGIEYHYYTGNDPLLNPTSTSYDPNAFRCDIATGWVTSAPADMSTVRAVKGIISPAAGAAIGADSALRMFTYSQIHADVPVGQDIWHFTEYSVNGGSTWFTPHRAMDSTGMAPSSTETPGARYPYTGGGRDVMRIIDATPVIDKAVDQVETLPGATVNYTITVRAEAPIDTTIDELIVVDTLPAGVDYVVGSGNPVPASVNGSEVTWELEDVDTNTDYVLTLTGRLSDTAAPGDTFTNSVATSLGGVNVSADASTRVRDHGITMLTKTADAAKVPHSDGVAEDAWTVRITSEDSRAQAFTDTIDLLPYNGDGRGTSFSGSYVLSGPIDTVTGATVYYTTGDPATLVLDPADPSNGAAGDVTGNTVGWSTTFTEQATAVRVIGPALPANSQQEFTISVVTIGAEAEDRYVNVAESRAERTQLVMRTSSPFEIGAVNSVALKKYILDGDDDWADANDIDDYPEFHTGDTLTYRLVVTNTGDQTLTDLAITDDRVDLAALNPLPVGLAAGALIPTLLPGTANAVTIEYEVPLLERPAGDLLVNTACVGPTADSVPDPGEGYDAPEVEESCDPAGARILPSSLTLEKVAAGASVHLGGAEWELTPVDSANDPAGAALLIEDCVADVAEDCTGVDANPAAGIITVDPIEDGRYRLVETSAPAGYKLDSTPRYVDVLGVTALAEVIENDLSEVPGMPLTGGVGALTFWAGAGLLGLAVAGGLIWQRRRTLLTT